MTNPWHEEPSTPPPEERLESPNLWRPADDLPLDHQPAAGRPALVLGIVGDSGSGKNTVADAVASLLGPDRITDVRLDDYHRFTREERALRGLTSLNPMVHNLALMQEHLRLLRQRRPIRNRSYSHGDGTFGPIRTIAANEIVLVRGLLGFPTKELQSLYDISVFLQPEPELLFRWKLRRDVRSRGYGEAEVLKYIAGHLLDAKEFVLPQAERAHLHVAYSVPDPEADDSEVTVTLKLRREAADAARETALFAGLPVVCTEGDGEVVVEVPADVGEDALDRWARSRFQKSYDPKVIGAFIDEQGATGRQPALGVVEVLIATLAEERAAAAAT
jgi:phosphoribulokinase